MIKEFKGNIFDVRADIICCGVKDDGNLMTYGLAKQIRDRIFSYDPNNELDKISARKGTLFGRTMILDGTHTTEKCHVACCYIYDAGNVAKSDALRSCMRSLRLYAERESTDKNPSIAIPRYIGGKHCGPFVRHVIEQNFSGYAGTVYIVDHNTEDKAHNFGIRAVIPGTSILDDYLLLAKSEDEAKRFFLNEFPRSDIREVVRYSDTMIHKRGYSVHKMEAKQTYVWKDIVCIRGEVYAESFEISGEMDGDLYRIDDFIYAVAAKYHEDPDNIQTYMMDGIQFDPSGLPFSAEDCGCYINGIAEWLLF